MVVAGDECQIEDCDGTIEVPRDQQHPAGPDIQSYETPTQTGVCDACGCEYERTTGIPPGPWGPKVA
jgi:hypothetical protein